MRYIENRLKLTRTRGKRLSCPEGKSLTRGYQNGCNFGRGLCKKWGFEDLEFLGTYHQYEKFMTENDYKIARNWPNACDPEWQIAGGICKSRKIHQVK